MKKNPEACVLAEGLYKNYGRKEAVASLDLKVHPGEIYGLLGPNGAGKTTTLKMLGGLVHPDRGAIAICGWDMRQHPLEAKALLGFIPDQPFIYESLTGREFLQFVANLYHLDRKTTAERLEALASEFEAEDWLDLRAESYSHGMRQKLVLAAALLHRPRVYLIDEPMVGLDPASILKVRKIFKREAAAGAGIVLSTHTLSLAESICSRIGIISQGRLVAQGTIPQLRRLSRHRHTDLERLYLEFTQSCY